MKEYAKKTRKTIKKARYVVFSPAKLIKHYPYLIRKAIAQRTIVLLLAENEHLHRFYRTKISGNST